MERGQDADPRSRSSSKTSVPIVDHQEDEDELDSSDEDDQYLDPGEPYGAFLTPTQQPYDRRERVEQLNKRLQDTAPPRRRAPVRVRIHEERNQYFFEDSDSDSSPPDEVVRAPKARESQGSSPRQSSTATEWQRTSASEGQNRPPGAEQRPTTPRQHDGDFKRPHSNQKK